MNAKLIAAAVAAFIIGHDIAVMRANRRTANLQANLDKNEKAAVMLRWFHAGCEVALDDKESVAKAYAKHFPTPPLHTQN